MAIKSLQKIGTAADFIFSSKLRHRRISHLLLRVLEIGQPCMMGLSPTIPSNDISKEYEGRAAREIWPTRYMQFLYLGMKRQGLATHHQSRWFRRKEMLIDLVFMLILAAVIVLTVLRVPLLEVFRPLFSRLLERRRNPMRSRKATSRRISAGTVAE